MSEKRDEPPAMTANEHHASSWRQRVVDALYQPVDAANLAYCRIAFGVLMLWETGQIIRLDWARRHYSDLNLYFTYWPFDFIQPWPGNGMEIHLYAMALAAICLACGLFYRVCTGLFFLMFTYVFLLEKSLYLNHFYFFSLVAFLMIFAPAQRYWSLDAWRRPGMRSRTVPIWPIWLLRFQVGVVYFFGGVAKINPDWLRGEPMREWLAQRTDFPLIGPWFTNEAVGWAVTYGALCFDLFVVFLLLNRRTRGLGYLTALLFHFINSRLFNIGVFPWMMIALTAVFFDPDWPRQTLQALRRGRLRRRLVLVVAGGLGCYLGMWLPGRFSWMHAVIGALGAVIAAQHLDESFRRAAPEPASETAEPGALEEGVPDWEPPAHRPMQPWLLAFLGIWVVTQLLIPLRHLIIPGNVHWTDEGRLFSWHMLSRTKDGGGYFTITDPDTDKTWYINPRKYLSSRQHRVMPSRPDMILQFVRYLAERMRQQGYPNVEIRADFIASLNGRKAQKLIDPDADLAAVPYPWWGHAEWIRPLSVPLSERRN